MISARPVIAANGIPFPSDLAVRIKIRLNPEQ